MAEGTSPRHFDPRNSIMQPSPSPSPLSGEKTAQTVTGPHDPGHLGHHRGSSPRLPELFTFVMPTPTTNTRRRRGDFRAAEGMAPVEDPDAIAADSVSQRLNEACSETRCFQVRVSQTQASGAGPRHRGRGRVKGTGRESAQSVCAGAAALAARLLR